jgi:hypothetical protein
MSFNKAGSHKGSLHVSSFGTAASRRGGGKSGPSKGGPSKGLSKETAELLDGMMKQSGLNRRQVSTALTEITIVMRHSDGGTNEG